MNKEVLRFRVLGRGERVLALLTEGEPREAFPRSLLEIRRAVANASGLTREQVERVEPLAADVRPGGSDGRRHVSRMAKLRLLAEVVGVRFDDLRQREQERRVRGLAAAMGAMVALVVVMAALVFVAVRQSRLAEARQQEADRQKAAALASDRTSRRRLADLYTRNGWATVDAGDPSTALLWFVKAIETAGDDPTNAEAARIRLGTTLAAAPR